LEISSQSRIAKAEASDPGVSMDLLVRALLATEMTRSGLASAIHKKTQPIDIAIIEL
jgi:hypothetical protein